MATDFEALFRLQKGYVEPQPLPELEHPVLFSQKRLFRDMAAAVLNDVHAGLLSASDEVPPTQALQGYLSSLQSHFGLENCLRVATFHGLSGSHIPKGDIQRQVTRADFPVPFNLFGRAGFWNRARGVNSEPPSSSLELQANVLHTLASLQTGSEVQ